MFFFIFHHVVECQPGTRQLDSWCVYCDRGTYQHGSGQPECISCPDGKTTEFLGARSETECIGTLVTLAKYTESVSLKKLYFQRFPFIFCVLR